MPTPLIALNEDALECRSAIDEGIDVGDGPKCVGMQADGVSCESVEAQCDVCANRYWRCPS
jgi:hypothetical protein